ncbi:YojF family protein [Bacillus carboniphilus]|uniref:YojF family protein n=1 Tax=Bacillus carboniphilus TaxID=86663 RepID=A0ABN0WL05_9BACI
MKPVVVGEVQRKLEEFKKQEVYIHLETTNGAYASHQDENFFSAGAYIRNAKLEYEIGKITGDGPYRVGLKLPFGWVYAEGITDFEIDDQDRLLMAGHDFQGKLAVALQISRNPFN